MGKQIDILVIDDNDIQLEFLEHLFDTHGFSCHTSDDNMQALELIQEIKPRLVLLDIMMPNVDGFTILKTIRDTKGLENLPGGYLYQQSISGRSKKSDESWCYRLSD